MAACVTLVLILMISGTIPLASTQVQRGYDLTVTRFPSDINRIILACVDTSNGELVLEASFFRNGMLYNLPQSVVIDGVGVRFVVDRSSEGNFTCGEVGRTSVPARTIVARPEGTESPEVQTTFYADKGSPARLDCSITPGEQLSLYYVTWRNASDHSVIFYQIFPLLSSGQLETNVLDSRYDMNVRNFSLFISDAGVADAADQYQCVLGVVDPTTDQMYEYSGTRDVNISLSVFKAPQFVEEPTSLVVRNGTDVTFTCAVISSPADSPIGWMLGDRTLNPDDEGILIDEDVDQVSRGIRTTSSLTIFDATGLDSNTVACHSEYSVTGGVIVSRVRSEALLNVLDEVNLHPPIPFQSGGFIFTIIPKSPLLIPVRVKLRYTNVETGVPFPVKSITTYYNMTPIYHIAFRVQVPAYNSFYLGVALFYEDVEGPMTESRDVYRRNVSELGAKTGSPDNLNSIGHNTPFWVVLSVLVLLVLVILATFAITQLLSRLPPKENTELKDGVRGMEECIKTADRRSITCCSPTINNITHDGSDDEEDLSENGFDTELALNLVEHLDRTIKFCRGNRVIAKVLKEKQILEASSPTRIIGSGGTIITMEVDDIGS